MFGAENDRVESGEARVSFLRRRPLGVPLLIWFAVPLVTFLVGWIAVMASATTATLSVTSDPPGAAVLLDGAPAGTTPLELRLLRPGRSYTLRLEARGYKPFEQPFVAEDESPPLNVGQDEAIEALTCAFSRVLAGLRDPARPALTALLLGPTGVGKTETARALADALFGSEHALTQVNCEEYAQGHELAKLLGAPPGYVGHQLEPLLSQRRLDEPCHRALAAGTGMVGEADGFRGTAPPGQPRPLTALSVVLFDEVEKAHPTLWHAMLGILEDGRLTLGNNTTTDFSHSIVLMTSNVGSREMSHLIHGVPLGFRAAAGAPAAIRQAPLVAARSVFPVEFLNRFDRILVYGPLEPRHLDQIFDRFLARIHARALTRAGVPIVLRVSPGARALVIARGSDLALGARPLRRAVESDLVDPLSRLIAAHRLEPGDVIEVEREGDELVFYRTRNHAGLAAPLAAGDRSARA